MYVHWCEGLDYVRIDNILIVAPEHLPQILAGTLEILADTEPVKHWFVRTEALRRIKAGLMDDDMRDAYVEALRINVEDTKRDLELMRAILRPKPRLVKNGAA